MKLNQPLWAVVDKNNEVVDQGGSYRIGVREWCEAELKDIERRFASTIARDGIGPLRVVPVQIVEVQHGE